METEREATLVAEATDHAGTGARARVRAWLETPPVRNTILGVIIFNAAMLGASTSDLLIARAGGLIQALDTAVVVFFVAEIALKIWAYGLGFWRNPWNIFDVVVIGIGLLPQNGSLRALRALRIIRGLRLLSLLPQMRAVVQALITALPGMGSVIVMLAIVVYVFGVMATLMFGDAYPDFFGTLGNSFFSLFQIMTLEGWPDIARSVMQTYPWAWAFFVPFILTTTFSVLNLFVGLLVNTMQSAVEEKQEAELEQLYQHVTEQSDRLMAEIAALRATINQTGSKA